MPGPGIRLSRLERPPYGEAVTSEEDTTLRRLGQALETVSRWEHDVTGSRSGGWQAAPGSELEIDDQLAHPFTVSALRGARSLLPSATLGCFGTASSGRPDQPRCMLRVRYTPTGS
jgi:hypothetical protein